MPIRRLYLKYQMNKKNKEFKLIKKIPFRFSSETVYINFLINGNGKRKLVIDGLVTTHEAQQFINHVRKHWEINKEDSFFDLLGRKYTINKYNRYVVIEDSIEEDGVH